MSSPFKMKDKTLLGKRSRLDANVNDDADATIIPKSGVEQQWSKSKKKRMRLRLMKHKQKGIADVTDDNIEKRNFSERKNIKTMPRTEMYSTSLYGIADHTALQLRQQEGQSLAKVGASSALQKSFQERLSGSRFRILNEELYTSSSAAAFKRFQKNPTLFEEYHEGFRHQVEQWPLNPVTVIVEQIRILYQNAAKKSKKSKKVVVADFGCGEAELAKHLLSIRDGDDNCPFKVYSFDLVAKGPNADLITACDATNTPLTSETIDVGIFCLALMGTNLADFIREGYRVLKPDGILIIAEVRSRFESTTNDDTNSNLKGLKKGVDALKDFIHALDQLGFMTYHTDRSNKMFLLLQLKKNGKKPKENVNFTAKPCIYKRR
jgi:ribosomal RNA-processing protein 8